MATITRAQLADIVLEHIGAKAANQAADAADSVKATDTIDAVRAELTRDDVPEWAADSIPDWAVLPMRDIVSFELRNTFGLSGERLNDVINAYGLATRKIYKFTAGKHDPHVPMRATYY